MLVKGFDVPRPDWTYVGRTFRFVNRVALDPVDTLMVLNVDGAF